jgi:hypothetical protein
VGFRVRKLIQFAGTVYFRPAVLLWFESEGRKERRKKNFYSVETSGESGGADESKNKTNKFERIYVTANVHDKIQTLLHTADVIIVYVRHVLKKYGVKKK